VSALLVYKNATPEAMAWAEDFKARTRKTLDARAEWMSALYDAHGVPDDEQSRGAFVREETFSGLAWPNDCPLPNGWFRPVKTPQLIRPLGNRKAGKVALAEMAKLNYPDARQEMRERLGMPGHAFVGLGLYRPGVKPEDDAVWVTWGTRDASDVIGNVASFGWQRVPLVEYIARFGEDAL
jgi:hypothetical protein